MRFVKHIRFSHPNHAKGVSVCDAVATSFAARQLHFERSENFICAKCNIVHLCLRADNDVTVCDCK